MFCYILHGLYYIMDMGDGWMSGDMDMHVYVEDGKWIYLNIA